MGSSNQRQSKLKYNFLNPIKLPGNHWRIDNRSLSQKPTLFQYVPDRCGDGDDVGDTDVQLSVVRERRSKLRWKRVEVTPNSLTSLISFPVTDDTRVPLDLPLIPSPLVRSSFHSSSNFRGRLKITSRYTQLPWDAILAITLSPPPSHNAPFPSFVYYANLYIESE